MVSCVVSGFAGWFFCLGPILVHTVAFPTIWRNVRVSRMVYTNPINGGIPSTVADFGPFYQAETLKLLKAHMQGRPFDPACALKVGVSWPTIFSERAARIRKTH